ncbi:MAG: DUF1998 domain-containing protein [Deltaproteobacteria bacterium]|nr:DUF1998 domain-containing protein [Deltaproteobacteria bacterium]
MIDLPNHAVIVGGLEGWGDPSRDGFQPIHEERLIATLQRELSLPSLKLYAPPVENDPDAATRKGVKVWLFPEWFVAQHEESWGDGMRARPLVHIRALVSGQYQHPGIKKKVPVVPMRFVQACVRGHISDIDWYRFIHGPDDKCRRPLWLLERGTSGDLADTFLRCECKKSRTLATATQGGEGSSALGQCWGKRPWLGNGADEKCGGELDKPEMNRLLVRHASNAYFPQVVRVISIPDRDAALRKAVDEVWDDYLQYAEEVGDVAKERKKAKVTAALEGFTNEAVFEELQRRKQGTGGNDKPSKQIEIEALLASPDEVGEDAPEGDFFARTLPLVKGDDPVLDALDRVVLVHRLREVAAQVGFTRFEPPTTDLDELKLEVKRADLAREVTWLPATEIHGEGVLLSFKREKLEAWLKRPAVKRRLDELVAGHDARFAGYGKDAPKFPGGLFVLLHSLSHLLITAVALECGYAASSIRERIYVTQGGCGILLYTGTPDSEGTLGGLVQVGRRIDHYLREALDLGRLCSNDPVCAQHKPDNANEERFLHGAACHGCLLIAETSCERRNEYLDRALVVATVCDQEAELFADEE